MPVEAPRSRAARAAAEHALIQVVNHYGGQPEFVILGGLVPELLCADSNFEHAGTTDVDVQVDLEIACGSVNTKRLEKALRMARFVPDGERAWRWETANAEQTTVIKFELLADLDDQPAEATIHFNDCAHLAAVNLRGTGYAARDFIVRELTSQLSGDKLTCEIRITGLAGFMLAKCAAARARSKAKDWYDIAFVLLHNDAGGPEEAVQAVLEQFEPELQSLRTSLDDLRANFATPDAQGPLAYAGQMLVDHPELNRATLATDAVLAIEIFYKGLFSD